MSKRKLLRLVEEGHVAGWDDPRMPTIAAQRREASAPKRVRAFCESIGVTKVNGSVDLARTSSPCATTSTPSPRACWR
jgi:glutaminyl-tRNA synthetase